MSREANAIANHAIHLQAASRDPNPPEGGTPTRAVTRKAHETEARRRSSERLANLVEPVPG